MEMHSGMFHLVSQTRFSGAHLRKPFLQSYCYLFTGNLTILLSVVDTALCQFVYTSNCLVEYEETAHAQYTPNEDFRHCFAEKRISVLAHRIGRRGQREGRGRLPWLPVWFHARASQLAPRGAHVGGRLENSAKRVLKRSGPPRRHRGLGREILRARSAKRRPGREGWASGPRPLDCPSALYCSCGLQ